MDVSRLVRSSADPVFATNQDNRIIAWNDAMAKLVGRDTAQVLGHPCHEILCGKDAFGNKYCNGGGCGVREMVGREEPVRRFILAVEDASGKPVRVAYSILAIHRGERSEHTVVHLLQPLEPSGESAPLKTRAAFVPAPRPSSPELRPPAANPLTPREIEVFHLIADGVSTQEIAERLFISIVTVRNHIQRILRKLEVRNRLEAVCRGLRTGLI